MNCKFSRTDAELKASSCFQVSACKFFSTFAMCRLGLAGITQEVLCILSSFKQTVFINWDFS